MLRGACAPQPPPHTRKMKKPANKRKKTFIFWAADSVSTWKMALTFSNNFFLFELDSTYNPTYISAFFFLSSPFWQAGINWRPHAIRSLFFAQSVTHNTHKHHSHHQPTHAVLLCAIAARTNAFNNIPTEEQKTQNENDKLLWTNRIECRTNDDRIFLSYSAVSLYIFF